MQFKADTPDVLVIGGGLIGCAIALRLAQQKLRVAVVERGEPGAEASSAGAGMIAPQGETVQPDEHFTLCAQSRDLYPNFVREVEDLSGSDVHLRRDGTLMVALNGNGARDLEMTFDGQSRAGLTIKRLTPAEARQRAPALSPDVSDALLIPGDYWLDNERLAQSLAKACRARGVVFHSQTAVRRLDVAGGRVESAEAESGVSFRAGEFVLAAGAWSGEIARTARVSIPVQPCRGQMIEFEGAENFPVTIRAGHHYIVPRSDGRIIAGSTMEYAGYEKAVTGEGLLSILSGAARMAPCVRTLRFRRCWAGLRPDTLDHRPILGRAALSNLAFATGHFRNGILLTPITAKLISELIVTGRASPALAPYSPARFAADLQE